MFLSGSLSRFTKMLAACCLGALTLPALAQAPPAASSNATSQVTLASGLGSASGLAIDQTGSVYTTDGVNNTLSLITGANGPANIVLPGLSSPGQIALDNARNVYIAAGTQNVVLKFTYTAGALNLNTPASLGTGLGNVVGVAVDLTGNVYIVDATNKQVVKVTPAGVQTTLLSNLVAPKQIAVDRLGNVFVADSGANSVVYLPVGTTVPSTVGFGLNAPSGVAVDPTNNLYIADTGNSQVEEVPNVAGVPTTANQTILAVNLPAPTSIASDTRGSLYVGGSGKIVHFSLGAVYFGLIQVKQTTQITPVTITFTQTVAPAVIKVVATGTTGLDFADAGGDSSSSAPRCSAGATYSAGQSCSINVTFTPLYAGSRYGAIVMYDASNKVVSRTFIGGGGLGPVLTFDPPRTVSLIPLSYNAPGNSVPLSAPHGIKFDSAGNTFFADTNSNRVTVIPAADANGVVAKPTSVALSYTLNDMTINGAGDLVVPDLSTGRMTVVPYENGTWNFADVIISGTGYGKPRVVNVDVAGTMFFCDVTNNRILSITIQGLQTQLAPGLTKGCLGVDVDLYGNVAVSDSGAAIGYYIPINGQAPYAIGSGANLNGVWGVKMDASGSVYLASNASGAAVRVPNENGTLSTADQELLTLNKAYGITVDATGNIFSVPLVGTTLPASGYNFNAFIRGGPVTFPQPLTSTNVTQCTQPAASVSSIYVQEVFTASCLNPSAVGATSAGIAITVANAGNQLPIYSNPDGVSLFGDIDDFPLGAPTPATIPKYPPCNFTNPLLPGAACYISASFSPQSPGTLRQAYLTIPTQDPTPAIFNLLAFTAGSPNSSSPGLTFAQTVPMGNAGPFQDIQFTFTTSDTSATGSISVTVDGVQLASAELVSGVASFELPAGLAAGVHKVTATYSGDGKFAPSTTPSIISITVSPQTATFKLASSAISANPGQAVTLTATLGGGAGVPLPSGNVVFFDGATMLGVGAITNGNASFSTSTLASGPHVITYRYMGDSVYASGTSPAVTVTISTFTATATTVTITPVQPANGYIYGTALTVVATVNPGTGTGTPTGSVLFNLDGAVTSVALSGKTATFTVTPNAKTYTLAASYSGDTTYATSTGTATFTVIPIATITTLKASSTSFAAGSNVTLTASVMSAIGIPASGTFTFRNKATVLGTVNLVKGVGTLTTSALPGGVDSVTATYSGDANDNTSTSAAMTINAAFNATTLTTGAATVLVYFPTVAVPNTLTATVKSSAPASVVIAPTGSVTFMINGAPAVTNYIPEVKAVPASPGVAAVAGVPAVLSVPVGPVAVSGSGIASLNQSPSSQNDAMGNAIPPTGYKYGINTVSATYSGDNDYSPSSTTVTFNYYIVPPSGYDGDYTISATPTAYPITIGTTGSGTITITPVAKYFGYVQVSCAGLPLYATCILAPDQVLLDGTGTSRTMALTILTQAPILVGSVTREQVASRLAGMLGAPVLLVVMLGSFRRGRRAMRSAGLRGLLFLLLLSAGLGSTTACGSHPPIATPGGTYTVQITGTGSGPLNTTITDITDPRYGAPMPIVHSIPVTMTFK